jgi:hypothetical protein
MPDPVTYKVVDHPWSPSEPSGSEADLNVQGQDGWQLQAVYPDPQREKTRWIFSQGTTSGGGGGVGIPEAPTDGAQYGRQSSSWTPITSTAGPAGPSGPPGPQGVQGPAGPAGPAGPSAVSTNAGNQAKLGTDSLIFVPPLKGVVDGSDAAPGMVGEVISASNTVGYNLTTAIASNVVTLVLPPGDWNVGGVIIFAPTSTGPNSVIAALSQTSATLPPDSDVATGKAIMQQIWASSMPSGKTQTTPTSLIRVSTAVQKTVYLVAQATFGGGSVNVTGYASARRIR